MYSFKQEDHSHSQLDCQELNTELIKDDSSPFIKSSNEALPLHSQSQSELDIYYSGLLGLKCKY